MDSASMGTVSRLKDVILQQALEHKQAALETAQKKSEMLLAEGEEKLATQCMVILDDAKHRAETVRLQQSRRVRRKSAGGLLKLQNSLLEELTHKLEQQLVALRGQKKYPEVLCGMALCGAQTLGGNHFLLQFAAEDATIAHEVVEKLSAIAKGLCFSVDDTAALISGGLYVLDAAGKRRVCLDFESLAREKADSAAEQLFATV